MRLINKTNRKKITSVLISAYISASKEKVDKIQHIFYESAVMTSTKFSPLKMEQSLSKFGFSLRLQVLLKKLT